MIANIVITALALLSLFVGIYFNNLDNKKIRQFQAGMFIGYSVGMVAILVFRLFG